MKMICQYCKSTEHCDCEERINCPDAGKIGHSMCGRKDCGCPRFIPCNHDYIYVVEWYRYSPNPNLGWYRSAEKGLTDIEYESIAEVRRMVLKFKPKSVRQRPVRKDQDAVVRWADLGNEILIVRQYRGLVE